MYCHSKALCYRQQCIWIKRIALCRRKTSEPSNTSHLHFSVPLIKCTSLTGHVLYSILSTTVHPATLNCIYIVAYHSDFGIMQNLLFILAPKSSSHYEVLPPHLVLLNSPPRQIRNFSCDTINHSRSFR